MTYFSTFQEHANDELDPNLPTIKDLGVKLTYFENIANQFVYINREEPLYNPDTYEFEVSLPPVMEELK